MSLLLFPNLLAEGILPDQVLPRSVGEAARTIEGLIAESEKGGAHFLRLFSIGKLPIKILNEHTNDREVDELLIPLVQGKRWGLVSDCGLPCLADPGAKLVFRARKRGIIIQAFVGPSAITLALMLSGLPGQKFTFHGYLEREEETLKKQIRLLDRRSQQEQSTELFIEAPYRNQKLLRALLENLQGTTLLSIAWDLTLPSEGVITESVSTWRGKSLPDIHKKPAVFLFSSRG